MSQLLGAVTTLFGLIGFTDSLSFCTWEPPVSKSKSGPDLATTAAQLRLFTLSFQQSVAFADLVFVALLPVACLPPAARRFAAHKPVVASFQLVVCQSTALQPLAKVLPPLSNKIHPRQGEKVPRKTYGPINWKRINRFFFGSDSSFPNATYNSPLYCVLQVCLFSPPSLP
ncbi:hypothetical protein V6N11_070039 [Hibiscus sabdariffa]|uniref:Secreted protein n=1 Tax=Hibiscus sabdariffa TaxID=183260 RepID=A0ABR2QDT2_9ROSI